MPGFLRDFARGRLARVLGALVLAFVAGALLLAPARLILLLNGLALAAGLSASLAYLPVGAKALRRDVPERGDVLGAGIFFCGLSDAALRLQSIVARDFGWPAIFNTHIAAVSIFLGIMGLVAFLWAPYAEHGDVPRTQWGWAAGIGAAGLAIALAAAWAQQLLPPPLVRLQ